MALRGFLHMSVHHRPAQTQLELLLRVVEEAVPGLDRQL